MPAPTTMVADEPSINSTAAIPMTRISSTTASSARSTTPTLATPAGCQFRPGSGRRAGSGASGRPPRREDGGVRSFDPDQLSWLVQPLTDAGLELEGIRRLLFRLCF